MQDTQKILAVLKEIETLENTISDFYAVCSRVYQDTSKMWRDLSEEEKKHAGYVKEIINAIEKEPQKFTADCKFTIETVRTVISGVKERIEQVKNKEISERQALFIAKDIEYSSLEKNFCNIVHSPDPQHKNIIGKLIEETKKQREFLTATITHLV
jgi:rubrerythrin